MTSHQISVNPYAPPAAEVRDIEVVREGVLAFPRFSAWYVILLSIVTLGVYPLYWLYKRTSIANTILPHRPISMAFVVATLVVTAAEFVLALPLSVDPENVALQSLSKLVTLAARVMQLVWLFQFRNRLSEISNKPKVGGVLTFFFGQIYLQYKINEFIDAIQQNHAEESRNRETTTA